MSYSVRATIKVDGQLRFISDTMHPVLTRGAGSDVEIWMKMAGGRTGSIAAKPTVTIMCGELSKGIDGELFTDAMSGKRHELAAGGDRGRLDQAYDQAGRESDRLYMTFEGTIDDEGKVHVTRFINAWPGHDNERSRADSSLINTYWHIVSMEGDKVPVINPKKEPHILLKDVDGQNRCFATVGCNQLVGGYAAEGDGLNFSMMVTTLMACVPPLDMLEYALKKVLSETRRYRIKEQTLELFDQKGDSIALLEAVYL
jgi:copper homeostasis protein (lipoprotein)